MKSLLGMTSYEKLCTPAKLYFLLSTISVIFYLFAMVSLNDNYVKSEKDENGIHNFTLLGLVVKVFFIVIWIAVLNWLCSKGKNWGRRLAWFLVLVPLLFFGLMIFALVLLGAMMAAHADEIDKLEIKSRENGKEKPSDMARQDAPPSQPVNRGLAPAPLADGPVGFSI